MGRRRTNGVYQYFKLDKNVYTSTCLVPGCDKVLKTLHGSNLLKHLERCHNEEFMNVYIQNKKTRSFDKETKIKRQEFLEIQETSSMEATSPTHSISNTTNEDNATSNNCIKLELYNSHEINRDPLNADIDRNSYTLDLENETLSNNIRNKGQNSNRSANFGARRKRLSNQYSVSSCSVVDKSEDALSKFFDYLLQKTRDLPKCLQIKVQKELFDCINSAEEEALRLES